MKTYFVVTGVVRYKDNVLILKKHSKDKNYPNCWSFCSGFVKEFEAAEDTVLREITEETGMRAKILKKGNIFEVEDKEKVWVVSCFLCEVDSDKVKLDHENTEFKWIDFKDIKDYDTVPGLKKDLKVMGLD